jgi:hypothetical protein
MSIEYELAAKLAAAEAAVKELGEAALTWRIQCSLGRAHEANEAVFASVLDKHGFRMGVYGLPDPVTPTREQLVEALRCAHEKWCDGLECPICPVLPQ